MSRVTQTLSYSMWKRLLAYRIWPGNSSQGASMSQPPTMR